MEEPTGQNLQRQIAALCKYLGVHLNSYTLDGGVRMYQVRDERGEKLQQFIDLADELGFDISRLTWRGKPIKGREVE